MPALTIVHGRTWPASSNPTRNAAIRSSGLRVAEHPTRCTGASTSSANRSRLTARCTPRLLSHSACTSSTITVRIVRRFGRMRLLCSNRYSDSGVVIRMCGGWRIMRARSACGVSPDRTAMRISGSWRRDPRRMPASGSTRFLWMSLPRALSGVMYNTCTPSVSSSRSPRRNRSSIAHRNAAKVLPDPVGANSSVLSPRRMTGQAWTWAGDGRSNVLSNHRATQGRNPSSAG